MECRHWQHLWGHGCLAGTLNNKSWIVGPQVLGRKKTGQGQCKVRFSKPEKNSLTVSSWGVELLHLFIKELRLKFCRTFQLLKPKTPTITSRIVRKKLPRKHQKTPGIKPMKRRVQLASSIFHWEASSPLDPDILWNDPRDSFVANNAKKKDGWKHTSFLKKPTTPHFYRFWSFSVALLRSFNFWSLFFEGG